MRPSYVISVDLGTTGTKAAAFDLEGHLISDAYQPTRLHYPKPGLVEQDPKDFYDTTVVTIRQVMGKSRIDPILVGALAIDSQMAGVLAIDKDWNPVTYYDSWLDSRCSKYVDLIRSNYEELVIKKVGAPPSIAHGPKMLWWKYERPRIFVKVSKFIMPNCYVVGRLANLTSEQAFIDYTFLHFTGFADADKGQWSQELCKLFKFPVEKLPQIVEPWSIVGELSREAALRCHLKPGTAIMAGAGDTAANSLGAGVVEPGMAFDVAGTASVFSCCTKDYAPDVENRTFTFPRSVVPGLWIPLAYIAGGGLCLKWFIDQIANNGTNPEKSEGKSPYQRLDKLAEKVPPGSDNLIFMPHFAGRTYPYNPHLRGAWIGLNWKHKQEHLYRSIMESISYEYDYYKSILTELLPNMRLKQVRVVGGGSQSKLFNQIKSDALGLPYVVLDRKELGVFGLALICGYGLGVYSDLKKQAQHFTRPLHIQRPSSENHALYEKYSKSYLEALNSISALYAGRRQGTEA